MSATPRFGPWAPMIATDGGLVAVFCGVLLGAASLGLDTGDRWWGILLSALMMLNGAATWAGAAQRQLNLLSGGFAGGMLLLALAFNFMATLHRNAVVDCALAELLSMDNAARTRLSERSAWKDTAMETITSRIEALDQTLHVMEHRSDLLLPSKEIDREGAVKELKAEHQSALYAAQDARLIEKKLKKAKEHGVAVLQGLLKLGIDPKGKFAALEEATSVSLPAGDVDKLKQRFESLFRDVEKLTVRLREHEEGEGQITAEEYQQLLAAVEHSTHRMGSFIKRVEIAAGKDKSPMTHDDFLKLMHGLDMDDETEEAPSRLPFKPLREDAAALAGALKRQALGSEGYVHLRNIDNKIVQNAWRRQWEAQLTKSLPSDGSASDALLDVPAKCVKGSVTRWLVTVVVLLAALSQAGCWHGILSAGLVRGQASSTERALFT